MLAKSAWKCISVSFALAALVGLVACDSGSSERSSQSTGEATFENLIVTLDIAPEAQRGEPVSLTLVARSLSGETVDVLLNGDPAYDFAVLSEDGTEVWRWGSGVANSILLGETLTAGEELRFDAKWDQEDNQGELVPPGTYEVRGILRILVDHGPQEPPETRELTTEGAPLVISE